jgi:hypothetical protein
MPIYRPNSKYRKIYEKHYGPIPKDSDGRTYDIHHIDGDIHNNDPSNLKAVSIQEHYDIHYQQKDYMACYLIGLRMNKSPQELSELSKKVQKQRVEEGSHHMLGGHVQRKRVQEGTHPWQDKEWHRRREQAKILQGKHIFLDGSLSRKITVKRLEDGTHNFLGNDNSKRFWSESSEDVLSVHREEAKERQIKKVKEGSHPFLGSGPASRAMHLKLIAEGRHVSQIERTCPHCTKVGKGPAMLRHHFDNCKRKT